MYHRYGRHGPHAWKRWHERRFSPRLPVVVPNVAVVRMHVPITLERIILIIMPDGNAREEWKDQSIQLGNDQTGSLVVVPGSATPPPEVTVYPSPDDDNLIQAAQWQAYPDAGEVADLLKRKALVRIDQSLVEEKIQRVIRRYFEGQRPLPGGPPRLVERERIATLCKKAYWDYFAQEMPEKQDRLIATEKEARLRDQALQDRETYPGYLVQQKFQRDLAVMRVLTLLGLSAFDVHLKTIHQFADKYEIYFQSQADEEETWPRPNSF